MEKHNSRSQAQFGFDDDDDDNEDDVDYDLFHTSLIQLRLPNTSN